MSPSVRAYRWLWRFSAAVGSGVCSRCLRARAGDCGCCRCRFCCSGRAGRSRFYVDVTAVAVGVAVSVAVGADVAVGASLWRSVWQCSSPGGQRRWRARRVGRRRREWHVTGIRGADRAGATISTLILLGPPVTGCRVNDRAAHTAFLALVEVVETNRIGIGNERSSRRRKSASVAQHVPEIRTSSSQPLKLGYVGPSLNFSAPIPGTDHWRSSSTGRLDSWRCRQFRNGDPSAAPSTKIANAPTNGARDSHVMPLRRRHSCCRTRSLLRCHRYAKSNPGHCAAKRRNLRSRRHYRCRGRR